MYKNKKGFTLVELLAVLVILGILITITFLAVKPRTRKARKQILVNDAKTYINASEQAYTLDDLDDDIICQNISDLAGNYVKADGDAYSGTIVTELNEGNIHHVISITNGVYYLYGSGDVSLDNVTDHMPSGFLASCNGFDETPTNNISSTTLAYKLLMSNGKSTLTENLSDIKRKSTSLDYSITETDASKSGLFQAQDDEGTTYFYRGVIDNNWIEFGGYYWRIVRINGDGSIRLIYSGLASSNHTGESAGIKNSANKTTMSYQNVTASYKAYTLDVSGLTNTQVETKYGNGRWASTYVGYMYNPKMVVETHQDAIPSDSKRVNTFQTYTGISNTTDYYFFKNFSLSSDCFAGNDNDNSGGCTLKCRELGVDCILSNYNTLATTEGNYSTTAAGIYPATNPTQYIFTSPYKYTCWNFTTPVLKNNSDGTTSVYITCPLVTEIVGTITNQATQTKIKVHGVFPESATVSNTNVQDSLVKQEIDLWYERTIKNHKDSDNMYDLESYISDGIFCNDRTPAVGNGDFPLGTNAGSYVYMPYTRSYSSKNPSYKCPDMANDAFTLSPTLNQSSVTPKNIGNKLLKYPVGLITMDEALFAGGKYNVANNSYYLRTGTSYYTMSPYGFLASNIQANIWYVNSTGSINGSNPSSNRSIRPVINLKSNVIYKSGTGTSADPYRITL